MVQFFFFLRLSKCLKQRITRIFMAELLSVSLFSSLLRSVRKRTFSIALIFVLSLFRLSFRTHSLLPFTMVIDY